MLTYVLDSSALLRFLDQEAGCDFVEKIIDEFGGRSARVIIPAVQWGEVIGILQKRKPAEVGQATILKVRELALPVIPADAQRAEKAMALKAAFRLSYMDAFAVELAQTSPDHILITADFDFKPAEQTVRIEFLPSKP